MFEIESRIVLEVSRVGGRLIQINAVCDGSNMENLNDFCLYLFNVGQGAKVVNLSKDDLAKMDQILEKYLKVLSLFDFSQLNIEYYKDIKKGIFLCL